MKKKPGRSGRKDNRCYMGHEMTPENSYPNTRGYMNCRQCSRDHWRRYYFAKRYGLKQPPPRGTDHARRGPKSVKDKSP